MSLPGTVTEETGSVRPSRKFEGHTEGVMGVIHLPGGQRIMTCSRDGSLRVWDLQTAKQIASDWRDEESDGESDVNTIALSPDGKKVASGSDDGVVRLWDIDIGKVIAKSTGHTGRVWCVCWSRSGGRVVSGALDDGTARVWDVESGKTVLAIETGCMNVDAVIYSPDTTIIATGGDNNEEDFLQIWDAKTGQLVANLKGHTGIVACLAWTADGKTLISGTYDHSIRTWNTTTWQQIAVLTGHTDYVLGIVISPNGRILASASWDKTVQLWNLETGRPIGLPFQHEDHVRCTSFPTDGMLLATGCDDKNAYMWDVSAIVKEAGLSELLLNSNEKSAAGATRPRGDWRRNPYPGPSNDTLRHPHLSGRFSSSARQQYISPHPSSHGFTPPGPISQFLGNDDHAGGLPTQPRFLQWARRNMFFHTRNSRIREGIKLQERRIEVVDVPLAERRLRNASARGVRIAREKEKARKAEIAKATERQKAGDAKNTESALEVGNSSRPSESNVNPQPGEGAQAQPTPGLHSAGLSTSPTPAAATASVVTTRWARFWSAACCIPAQNANVHH